jgi:hypothetical protein
MPSTIQSRESIARSALLALAAYSLPNADVALRKALRFASTSYTQQEVSQSETISLGGY